MKFPLGLFLSLFTVTALAHPGGLDKNGGHTDKKTGEYHYHKKTGADSPPPAATSPGPVMKKPTQPTPTTTTPLPRKVTTNATKPEPAVTAPAGPPDFGRLVADQIDPAKLVALSPPEVNPRVQKAVALLRQASLSGLEASEVVSNAVVIAGYTNAQLASLTGASLLRNFEIAGELGVLTEPGLSEMRQGQSPRIQVGPFSGDAMTVGPVVPLAAAPELATVIANLEFLPFKVNAAKGDNIGEQQRDLARKFHAAGMLTPARLNEILGR